MAKLSDRKKKTIIADYIETGNYSAVAKRHGVSRTTVKNIVTKDTETARRMQEQKEKNTQSVLKHMEKKAGDVCEIMDSLLGVLSDKEKLQEASVRELATALGILIDKFTKAGTDTESAGTGVILIPERKEEKDSGKPS